MLRTVFLSSTGAIRDISLKGGIYNEFLGDGVVSELPYERVLVALLLVMVVGVDHFVVVGLYLAVVLLDYLADLENLRMS